MKITRMSFAAAAAMLAIGYGTVQADQLRIVRPMHQIGGTAKLADPGPTVEDTCTDSIAGHQEACDIDQLTKRCDAAGGGMSSLPGGGVDCDLGPD